MVTIGAHRAGPSHTRQRASRDGRHGQPFTNYKKLQTQLSSLTTGSQQLSADKSFQSVEIDQPEAVGKGDQVRHRYGETLMPLKRLSFEVMLFALLGTAGCIHRQPMTYRLVKTDA